MVEARQSPQGMELHAQTAFELLRVTPDRGVEQLDQLGDVGVSGGAPQPFGFDRFMDVFPDQFRLRDARRQLLFDVLVVVDVEAGVGRLVGQLGPEFAEEERVSSSPAGELAARFRGGFFPAHDSASGLVWGGRIRAGEDFRDLISEFL